MDFELFKSIIDESAYYGPRSFSLHLFGEPLLYPKWQEAIEYIKKKNKRNTVLFTSNGTLFERYVDRLIKSDVDRVLWSWRPEAKWSESTQEKLKKWKAFTVRIIEEVTPKEAKEEFLKWPRVEQRSLHNYGGKINTSNFIVKDDRLTPENMRWSCYHLFYAPAVSWDGDILICCADPKKESTIGKFPEVSIAHVWQSSVIKRLREEQLNGKYTGICEKCDIWKQYKNIFWGHEYPVKGDSEIQQID